MGTENVCVPGVCIYMCVFMCVCVCTRGIHFFSLKKMFVPHYCIKVFNKMAGAVLQLSDWKLICSAGSSTLDLFAHPAHAWCS
jgi:hypothetical protein